MSHFYTVINGHMPSDNSHTTAPSPAAGVPGSHYDVHTAVNRMHITWHNREKGERAAVYREYRHDAVAFEIWQYYAAIGETIAARSSNCSGSAHLSVTWPVAMTFDAEARLLSPPRTHETATNWRLIHAFVAFVSIVQNLISNRNRCTHTDI